MQSDACPVPHQKIGTNYEVGNDLFNFLSPLHFLDYRKLPVLVHIG